MFLFGGRVGGGLGVGMWCGRKGIITHQMWREKINIFAGQMPRLTYPWRVPFLLAVSSFFSLLFLIVGGVEFSGDALSTKRATRADPCRPKAAPESPS